MNTGIKIFLFTARGFGLRDAIHSALFLAA
jgi:hypothetical protein